MPARIIKESINESRGLAESSPFAQDLYKRLITYADDYGRFNADSELIRARLYPRELDAVEEADIDDAICELVGTEKIRLYTAAASSRFSRGRVVFGYFPRWNDHQRLRNTRAKCPDPESEEVNDWTLRRFVPIALKIKIFERDGFTCQKCAASFALPGLSGRRAVRLLGSVLHIDHIVPVTRGGRATEENLRLLCAACNLSRPRIIDVSDLCGDSPPVAADCGDQPPVAATRAPAESNPTRNQLESNSLRGYVATADAESPPAHPPQGTASPVPKPDSVAEVFEHYRQHIQPQARLHATDKIKTRLKRWKVTDLKAAIDHFAADSWQMDHNAHRGAEWFFASDGRIEQYVNLKPSLGVKSKNGQTAMSVIDETTLAAAKAAHGEIQLSPAMEAALAQKRTA